MKGKNPKKFLFIGTNKWIVLVVWRSVKYFFAPNSDILYKAGKKMRRKRIRRQLQSISKLTAQAQNQYLDILLDPSFQGVDVADK